RAAHRDLRSFPTRRSSDLANTASGRMPTAAERSGDFSQTTNPLGQPVQVFDPLTGAPFAGNLIPQNRISPQARALMTLFPLPNLDRKSTRLNSSHVAISYA